MPLASSKSPISLEEVAICEDILGGHREYAIDLLSNLEHIRRSHKTDICPQTGDGPTCTLCELCGADGLKGASIEALSAYDDMERRLATERASLGESVPSCEAPGRETLFRNDFAKVVFLSIVTAGDTLRSQHATWQARLQSEISSSLSCAQSTQHTNASPCRLDKNRIEDPLLSAYSGPKAVRPKGGSNLCVASTRSLPENTSSPSMIVIIGRCLFSDCTCEENRANATNPNLRGAFGPQVISKVPPSPTDPEKTRASQVVAKSEAGGNRFPRHTTTNLERRPRKISDTSDALAKAKTDTQILKPSTYHGLSGPGARTTAALWPEDVTLKEPAPSSPAETETSSLSTGCGALITDPRVFRLRARIARFDDARRTLMEWCQVCMADLCLNPREMPKTGPEAGGSAERTRGHHSLGTVEPEKLVCTIGRVEIATSGDDAMTVDELGFNQQEQLEVCWLTARQGGRKRLEKDF